MGQGGGKGEPGEMGMFPLEPDLLPSMHHERMSAFLKNTSIIRFRSLVRGSGQQGMPGDCQGRTSARGMAEGEKADGEEQSKVESGCHYIQGLPGRSLGCRIANEGTGKSLCS